MQMFYNLHTYTSGRRSYLVKLYLLWFWQIICASWIQSSLFAILCKTPLLALNGQSKLKDGQVHFKSLVGLGLILHQTNKSLERADINIIKMLETDTFFWWKAYLHWIYAKILCKITSKILFLMKAYFYIVYMHRYCIKSHHRKYMRHLILYPVSKPTHYKTHRNIYIVAVFYKNSNWARLFTHEKFEVLY